MSSYATELTLKDEDGYDLNINRNVVDPSDRVLEFFALDKTGWGLSVTEEMATKLHDYLGKWIRGELDYG